MHPKTTEHAPRPAAAEALSGFPARLRERIGIWSGGEPNVTAFAETLKKMGVRGTSRANVYNYLREGARWQSPPIEFCVAAARLLGVRLTWLITGEGRPVSETNDRPELREFAWRQFDDALAEALPEAVYNQIDEVSRSNLQNLCGGLFSSWIQNFNHLTFSDYAPRELPTVLSWIESSARTAAATVIEPLRVFGIDGQNAQIGPGVPDPTSLARFFDLQSAAIGVLTPHMAEWSREWFGWADFSDPEMFADWRGLGTPYCHVFRTAGGELAGTCPEFSETGTCTHVERLREAAERVPFGGRAYEVVRVDSDAARCTCAAWRENRACVHVDLVSSLRLVTGGEAGHVLLGVWEGADPDGSEPSGGDER
jgi:hypothetical protein